MLPNKRNNHNDKFLSYCLPELAKGILTQHTHWAKRRYFASLNMTKRDNEDCSSYCYSVLHYKTNTKNPAGEQISAYMMKKTQLKTLSIGAKPNTFWLTMTMICLSFLLATSSCKCKKETTFGKDGNYSISYSNDFSKLLSSHNGLDKVIQEKLNIAVENGSAKISQSQFNDFLQNGKMSELISSAIDEYIKNYATYTFVDDDMRIQSGNIPAINNQYFTLKQGNNTKDIPFSVESKSFTYNKYIYNKIFDTDLVTKDIGIIEEINKFTDQNKNVYLELNLKGKTKERKIISSGVDANENKIFTGFLLKYKDILKFENIFVDYALYLQDYESIQTLFDNNLRAFGWIVDNTGSNIEKKVPVIKILQNRAKDSRFRLAFKNTTPYLITWDFKDFNQNLTPIIIDSMQKIIDNPLQVSKNSPQVTTSGDFSKAPVSWVINYGSVATTFFSTNFKAGENFFCGNFPNSSPVQNKNWCSLYRALTGNIADEDTWSTR